MSLRLKRHKKKESLSIRQGELPDLERDSTAADDGPLFRAHIGDLERNVAGLKTHVKQIIKFTKMVMEKEKEMEEIRRQFAESMEGLEVLAPIKEYLSACLAKQQKELEAYHINLENLVLNPLTSLYETDLKPVEKAKQEFDQESEGYYAMLEKYLATEPGVKKDKLDKTDQKFLEKRANFDLRRFDYMARMEENNTKNMQDVLLYVTNYAEKYRKYQLKVGKILEELDPQLQSVSDEVSQNLNHINAWIKSKDQKRKVMQELNEAANRSATAAAAAAGDGTAVPATPVDSKYKGIRDLDSSLRMDANQSSTREGFLYVKHGNIWKQVWCTLAVGFLYEYPANKMDPKYQHQIDLRTCTVKHAAKADRRFCMDLISPNSRRTYQATSEDETHAWMGAIQKAVEEALDTRMSFHDLADAKAAHGKQQTLLSELQSNPSNLFCADCNAPNPEWCCINLGALQCIECSGIHRSMGTHISKMRSLTLDTNWTPELMQVQRLLGNECVNAVFEAVPSEEFPKPGPTTPREEKQRYIEAKYATRAFVAPIPSDIDVQTFLLMAVKNHNLVDCLQAIAWRLNINGIGPKLKDKGKDAGGGPKEDVTISVSPASPSPSPPTSELGAPSPAPSTAPVSSERKLTTVAAAAAAVARERNLERSSSLQIPQRKQPKEGGAGEEDGASSSPGSRVSDVSSPSPISLLAFASALGNSSSSDIEREVSTASMHGRAALHLAVLDHNAVFAEFLLQNGANIDLPDGRRKYTPLHLAASRNDQAAIRYLLLKGADNAVRNRKDRVPFEVLKDQSDVDPEVLEALRPKVAAAPSSSFSPSTAATTTSAAATLTTTTPTTSTARGSSPSGMASSSSPSSASGSSSSSSSQQQQQQKMVKRSSSFSGILPIAPSLGGRSSSSNIRQASMS